MLRATKNFVEDNMPIFAMVVCGAFIVGLIVLGAKAMEADAAACEAKGGHISTSTGTGVGVSSKGGVTPVVTASSSCLTADGRIIENY